MSPRTRRIQRVSSLAGVFVLVFFVSFFAGTPTASAYCTSAPNACGQTNVGDTVYNGVCSTYSAPYLYTYNVTPSRNYLGTYDDFRGGGVNGQNTWTSLNLICQLAGYPGATGAYACSSNPYPYVCSLYDKYGTCQSWGYSYYPAESRHNGGWGYHLAGEGYCQDGGVQWAQCTAYTPVPAPSNASCPAPTSSLSISQNPVPYGGNPGFTLSSSNAYYCYVWVDGTYLVNGYTTSGTYYYGSFTSPGSHYAQSYCYNSAWAGSGWTGFYFTVDSPPTSSVSVSPNPVPYGANPAITLSSSNAYYCHVYMDWGNVSSGYFTSGTFYPGAMTSPGTHSAETYCYNSQWQNPNGWTVTYFTVASPPSASVSVSPNPVPYGGAPTFTLSTSNGYYSHVLMDGTWAWNASGYFTSGSYSPGALYSPGTHSAWAYTYNPVWVGSGWSTTNFTVSSPPTSSTSVSPNPVPYGANPAITLTSSGAYYCYVRMDGTDLPGTPGYFSSGTFYPGPQTSAGAHTASSYCYNSAWQGSGWTNVIFTVNHAPISSVSCSGSPSSVYVNQPVSWSSSVSGGSGSFSYSWSGTDGLSGSSSSVQKTYATAGAKTATVTVTDTVSGQTSSSSCNNGSGITVNSCTASLSANPSTVDQGQNVTLSWSVSGGSACATACSGSGFSTSGAISGSAPSSVPPAPPSTSYALTCSGGTYSSPPPANTTVTVIVPTVTITVNGQSPTARVNPSTNNNVSVAWSSANAASCSVARNGVAWKSGLSSNGVNDTVTAQTTYKADCVNGNGIHVTSSVVANISPGFTEF